ncbi:hypothetical protein HMPREF0262_02052 [Clostridium sp. ATCC 29733]|nr:hypothetical protein HMPREF0262_02052 [Clostridium sp. ATCC 29733]
MSTRWSAPADLACLKKRDSRDRAAAQNRGAGRCRGSFSSRAPPREEEKT